MADSAKIREITEKLENGIKDLFESDKYAEYLSCMAKFHNYSTRNTLLIYSQLPTASKVAGFHTWQKSFHRHVKKGEHGIQILAPVPHNETKEFEKLDPVTKQPVLDENGQPVMETLMRMGASFRPVYVYDVSQTVGEPIPELAETLTGEVERYDLFMDTLRAVSPLPIVFEPMTDKDGYCEFGVKIALNDGLSQIQTVSAAIHELAHAKLHDRNSLTADDKPKNNRTAEVEAESISYVVLQAFSIETGANSIGYVAEWGSGKDMKELNASLDIIRKTASEIIESIEKKSRELAKERGIDLSDPPQRPAELSEEQNLNMIDGIVNNEPPKTEPPKESEVRTAKYSGIQDKGIEIAKRYSHLSLKDRLGIIARVFGANSAEIKTKYCGGKYRGTSDVSIKFDNGAVLFLGNTLTPQAKQKGVIDIMVNDTLARYNPEIIKEIKETAAAALKEREVIDNAVAEQKGLKPYKFLTVELCDAANDNYFGWWYVTLAVDGKIVSLIETSLQYDIANGTLSPQPSHENYFVAGALKDTEADFVFNNAGHSSTNEWLYRVSLSDEARERAEAALSDKSIPPKSEKGVKHTLENKLFEQFAELFPEIASGEYSYQKLESDGFEPLSVEYIGDNEISVMHTYSMNGDLMYDPMVTFAIDRAAGTLTATSFEQSMPPLFQRVTENNGDGQSVDGNGNEKTIHGLRGQINQFAGQWLDNIESQQYLSVRATLAGREENAAVYFDDFGERIKPTPPPSEREPVKPMTAEDEAENRREELLYGTDPMPDPIFTIEDMNRYGYIDENMLPLQQETALELYDADHTIFLLYEDNTEAIAYDREEIENFEGFFGIERDEWENIVDFERVKDRTENSEGSKEALLIYGNDSQFGIYQIPGGIDELRDFRFASFRELDAHGITPDRDNYTLVYTGKLDIRDTQTNLHKIYSDFNDNLPPDYTGRSVSISDVIVLQWRGNVSSHYVDSAGFKELPTFLGEETSRNQEQPQEVTQEQPTFSALRKSSPEQPPMTRTKPSLLAELETSKRVAAQMNQSAVKTIERGGNKDDRDIHG